MMMACELLIRLDTLTSRHEGPSQPGPKLRALSEKKHACLKQLHEVAQSLIRAESQRRNQSQSTHWAELDKPRLVNMLWPLYYASLCSEDSDRVVYRASVSMIAETCSLPLAFTLVRAPGLFPAGRR